MKRYTEKKTIVFDYETVDKVTDLKDRFGLKFSEVVRECVELDLPKLIARHTKAQKRGQGRYRNHDKAKRDADSAQ